MPQARLVRLNVLFSAPLLGFCRRDGYVYFFIRGGKLHQGRHTMQGLQPTSRRQKKEDSNEVSKMQYGDVFLNIIRGKKDGVMVVMVMVPESV